VNPPSKRNWKRYVAGVSLGLGVVLDFPVLRQLMKPLFARSPMIPKRIDFSQAGPKFADMLLPMAERYHIAPSELVAFDTWLSQLEFRPSIISHPVADRMIEVDCADLCDRDVHASA